MNIILAIGFSLLNVNAAHAEIITCHQTEPFITETFNTDEGTATIVSASDPASDGQETGLNFVIKGRGKFLIKAADGSVRRELKLNGKGSDGMSDLSYPYDGGRGFNGPIGCESSELKAK